MLEEHHTVKQLPALVRRSLLPVENIRPAGEAKHVFTHQIWQMKLYTMETNAPGPAGWRFVPIAALDSLAIPTAVKVAKTLALQMERKCP